MLRFTRQFYCDTTAAKVDLLNLHEFLPPFILICCSEGKKTEQHGVFYLLDLLCLLLANWSYLRSGDVDCHYFSKQRRQQLEKAVQKMLTSFSVSVIKSDIIEISRGWSVKVKKNVRNNQKRNSANGNQWPTLAHSDVLQGERKKTTERIELYVFVPVHFYSLCDSDSDTEPRNSNTRVHGEEHRFYFISFYYVLWWQSEQIHTVQNNVTQHQTECIL